MPKKRKVCFVITSHIHYSRSKCVLQEIRDHPGLELQIAVAASAILPQYGDVLSAIKEDGFDVDAKIVMTLAGGNAIAMAKTTGIGMSEFATAFDSLKPDVVVVRGDRYEVLAAAVAAAYMNIPVAHIEGGDITGTIDESVRHAVTKLAHIHFATNPASHKNIVQMGENPDYVFTVGCPELEYLERHDEIVDFKEISNIGVGEPLKSGIPFMIAMYHPVTTETDNREKTESLLQLVRDLGIATVWFWPNADAGTDDVAKAIRVFREQGHPAHMYFIKYLSAEKFAALLKLCACFVGNSSAGIKEASFLGVPVVNIGTRQRGRMRGPNVIDTGHDPKEIRDAIRKQIAHGAYERSLIYYKPGCAKAIADSLATVKVSPQKEFFARK